MRYWTEGAINEYPNPASYRLEADNDQRTCGVDEYPMATTDEGGKGARVEEVPERENLSQGGTMRGFYLVHKMTDGDMFLIVIVNPHHVAEHGYQG